MKLFINPPGRKKYLRDYYCPSVAKSYYYYPPIDFIYMSAIKEEVDVIDFFSYKKVQPNFSKYDEMIILVSVLSFEEDIAFIRKIKKKYGIRIGVTGDVAKYFSNELTRKFDCIDFVIEDFFQYFKLNNPSYSFLPQYEKIAFDKYFFPFFKRFPVAHLLTDYGCTFGCEFCPISSIKHEYFPLDYIEQKIKKIVSMNIREVHLRDQTFGVKKSHFYQICELFKKYNISWSCFNRIDLMDNSKLEHLKNSGCHTIIFGIETASEASRKIHSKGMENIKIYDVLDYCKKIKIKTVGTFIIGLPNEKEQDFLKTIDFAKNLPLGYVSFNRASYRLNTKMALSQNYPKIENIFKYKFYCNNTKRIENFLKKANLSFYGRPSKIVFLLTNVLNIHLIKSFWNMFIKRLFTNRKI